MYGTYTDMYRTCTQKGINMQYKTNDYPPLPQELWTAVVQLVGQGTTAVYLADFLEYTGKKNTHSFRKAMQQLSDDGVVTIHQTRTPAGGRTVYYDLHPQFMQRLMDMPPF